MVYVRDNFAVVVTRTRVNQTNDVNIVNDTGINVYVQREVLP